MPLRLKFFLTFLLVASIPIALIGIFSFNEAQSEIEDRIVAQLVAVAEVQQHRVFEAIDRYLEQIKLVASRTQLRISLKDFQETGSEESLNRVNNIIKDANNSINTINTISIHSLEGVIVASTDRERIGETHERSEHQKASEKNFFINRVFKDKNNQLSVELFGPLILDGEIVGLVEVVSSGDPLVEITEDHSGLGETGEVILAQRNDAGDAVFLTPLRFDAGAALARAVSKEQINVPMTQAVAGEELVFRDKEIIDYRGRPVFAVSRFIAPVNWGLVVKVEREEVLAPIDTLLIAYLIIILISLVSIFLIAFFVSRVISKPISDLTVAVTKFQSGKLEQRVQIKDKGEIGKLGHTFNKMAEQLSKLYSSLEQQVAEKTEELKGALNNVQSQNKELEKTKSAVLNVLEDLEVEKKELSKAKAKDEAILSSIGDGLVVTDKEGRVTLVNNATLKLLKYDSIESLRGKAWLDIINAVDDENKQIDRKEMPISKALVTGETHSASVNKTIMFSRSDKTVFPIAVNASPIIIEDEIIGAVVVFRDITHERDIDKAKSEFVSLASHQLRTPLSTIGWYSEILLDGDAGQLSSDQKKYLEEISTGNSRMVELVNSLLNVSRIELGTFSVEPETLNPVSLFESVIKEQKPQTDAKNLKVEIDFSENIKEIQADPKLLRMVLQNLLSNAGKYTPEGGSIKLSMTIKNEGETWGEKPVKKESLCFSVADTGWGIPESQQSKIFTKLFRADNVKEKDAEGTGLGLYIVKSIIENSNGKIWFSSVEEKGTTFYVILPTDGMVQKKGAKSLE